MRTDENNNPTAFTTTLAAQGHLIPGTDYVEGTPFSVNGDPYYTAKLLGDPIEITKRLIDAVGFYTKGGTQRWVYIAMPSFVWRLLNDDAKRDVIGFMYRREGGSEMRELFPNY